MGVAQEPSSELVKVDEKMTLSGSRIEYFCTKGGPPLEELMTPIYRMATDSILAKTSQNHTVATAPQDANMLSSLSKEDDRA